MLTLGFKKGETFTIGDDIRITVLRQGTHGGSVRLAIEAPKHIPILREGVEDKNKQSFVNECGSPPHDIHEDYKDCHGGGVSGGI